MKRREWIKAGLAAGGFGFFGCSRPPEQGSAPAATTSGVVPKSEYGWIFGPKPMRFGIGRGPARPRVI